VSEGELYPWLVAGWFGLGVVVFVVLHFVAAPYGRHDRSRVGPTMSSRAGWLVMEVPAAVGVLTWFAVAGFPRGPLPLLLLWQLHYTYRGLVYPFLVRSKKPMPAVIALSGCAFNLVNTYLIGRGLTVYSPAYDAAWFRHPRTLAGIALFLAGFLLHVHSDRILRTLRASGDAGYAVPTGGMFRWVSCPNYLGEILQWIGFALAAAIPAAAAFALFTFANLAPRARAHHLWYRTTFPDYPKERRALIPLLY